jgi:hypothetical protein
MLWSLMFYGMRKNVSDDAGLRPWKGDLGARHPFLIIHFAAHPIGQAKPHHAIALTKKLLCEFPPIHDLARAQA